MRERVSQLVICMLNQDLLVGMYRVSLSSQYHYKPEQVHKDSKQMGIIPQATVLWRKSH